MDHQTLPRPALANVSFVTPRLAVGGDLSPDDDVAARQVAELVALGVTHVVDVRVEWTDEDLVAALAPSISHLHLGIDDAGQRIPDEWFDTGAGHVRTALAQADSVVVVHCHMGVNRGPSLGFAALLDAGWDPVDALDAIRRARPIAHCDYAEQALDWHHRRHHVPASRRTDDVGRLRNWRRANAVDVVEVVRGIRRLERRGVAVTAERCSALLADDPPDV